MVSCVVAITAFAAARAGHSKLFSPLILALLIGAAVRLVLRAGGPLSTGIKLTSRYALRMGIVLLGLQLSIGQVMGMGWSGVIIVVGALVATLLGTLWLGARLSVDAKLTLLIAAGTSICGASAVVATNTVARADDEDVAYALAAVSLFGTAAVFLYPVLGHLMRLSADAYGLWAGASIHEIGQVAAATQGPHPGGEIAMIAKLSRVALLAPTVLLLGTIGRGQNETNVARVPLQFPWFLVGFVALMVVGSTEWISVEHRMWGGQMALALLTVALAALGLDLDISKLRTRGWRPLILGAVAWAFITILTLACVLAWRLPA